MPICVECEYHNNNLVVTTCQNADSPITDFVRGRRDCEKLNPDGNCPNFKLQAQRESIYELKKDEELARTGLGEPPTYQGPLLPEKESEIKDKLATKGIYETEEDEKLAKTE